MISFCVKSANVVLNYRVFRVQISGIPVWFGTTIAIEFNVSVVPSTWDATLICTRKHFKPADLSVFTLKVQT